MLGVGISTEQERVSKIPTNIILLTFTIAPFIFYNYPKTLELN